MLFLSVVLAIRENGRGALGLVQENWCSELRMAIFEEVELC